MVKRFKMIPILAALLSILFSFNVIAMEYNDYEYVPKTPSTEQKCDDRNLNSRWTWLNDELCVRFDGGERITTERLISFYDLGLLSPWSEKKDGTRQAVKRETYTGAWSQDENGIWSFMFDDYTIPVGLIKIDGILYVFTGYGELKEGYEYWNGQKTGADGIVTENSQEFLEYLSTQYLPECYTVNQAK